MKHTILLIAMLAAFNAGAQITVTNATFPAVGDTLRTAFDANPGGIVMTPPGLNQQWDFSSLSATTTREQIIRPVAEGGATADFPAAEYFIEIANGGENYYNVTNEKVELIGFYGLDPIGLGFQLTTRFSPPILERRATLEIFQIHGSDAALLFPFSPDDVPGGIFDQLPISPDSLRVRVAIDRTDVVDAWGELTIPGGTYDVLREKRTEYREVRLDAKLPFVGWFDITDIALQSLPVPGLGVDTIIRYYYFNDVEKEPIAVVTVGDDQLSAVSVEYKANNTATSVQNTPDNGANVAVYPNPAITNIRFEFVNMPEGNYSLKFYNLLGKELMRRSYSIYGIQTEEVDVSSLRPGVYLCSVVNDKGVIVATRRIAVARP